MMLRMFTTKASERIKSTQTALMYTSCKCDSNHKLRGTQITENKVTLWQNVFCFFLLGAPYSSDVVQQCHEYSSEVQPAITTDVFGFIYQGKHSLTGREWKATEPSETTEPGNTAGEVSLVISQGPCLLQPPYSCRTLCLPVGLVNKTKEPCLHDSGFS